MSRIVLAAVAQLTSTPSVAANLATTTSLIRRAKARGAQMIFFPEAADYISPASDVGKLARPLNVGENEFVDGVKDAAREANMWVNICVHQVSASPTTEPGGRCFNTNIVISNEGYLVATYKKIHLYDVDLAPSGPTIKESNTTIPGTLLTQPVPTPVGSLGLQTCFDVRFTAPSNELARQGAIALTYPSAFAPHTGAAHWETLLRARAIENQCYVFASAQIGEHFKGRTSYGHAMIVDPWGTVVAQCPQTASPEGSLCYADVDLDLVAKIRREMPMGWPNYS